MKTIETVGVAGCGTMGAGIAIVAARAGFRTVVYDTREDALARARKVSVAMRPMGRGLPSGVAHLRLRAIGVTWEGTDHGHGRLGRRRLMLEASGKGAAGITRRFEVEDEGSHTVRVVSDVVVGETRRAAG